MVDHEETRGKLMADFENAMLQWKAKFFFGYKDMVEDFEANLKKKTQKKFLYGTMLRNISISKTEKVD